MASRIRSSRLNTIQAQDKELEKARNFCVQQVDQDGFTKHFINDEIGFGVFAATDFTKGSFLLEYGGELIDEKEATIRNVDYEAKNLGCYMYYFKDVKDCLCVDGTMSTQLGKFINDSVYVNSVIKKIDVFGTPHLCLFASKDISKGTELRYNYNDTGLPWRKKDLCKRPFQIKDIETNTDKKVNVKKVNQQDDQPSKRFKKSVVSDGGDQPVVDDQSDCQVSEDIETNADKKVNVKKGNQQDDQPSKRFKTSVVSDGGDQPVVDDQSDCQVSEPNDVYCVACKSVVETANTFCSANKHCENFLGSFCRACYNEHKCNVVVDKHKKTNEGVDVDFKCDEASYYKNGVLNVDLDPDAAAMKCSLCSIATTETTTCKISQCADHSKQFCMSCADEHVCRKQEEEDDTNEGQKDLKKVAPKDISVAEISDMVVSLKKKIMDIFTGKASCERDTRYKAGGRVRASLNMSVCFGVFTEEQNSAICFALMKMFCVKKMTANDLLLNGPDLHTNTSESSQSEAEVEAPSCEKTAAKKDSGKISSSPARNFKLVVKGDTKGKMSNKPLRRANERKRICPVKACAKEVYDLPRHMRQMHDWSSDISKSVNLLYENRKPYQWRQSPPKRTKKKPEQDTDHTRPKSRDYHKPTRCPIPGCFSVCKRIYQHLKRVHKLDASSTEYQEYLQKAVVVKDAMNNIKEWKKETQYMRRETIRENCEFAGTIPDFRESVSDNSVTYVAESKKDAKVIALRDKEKDDGGSSEIAVSNEEVLEKCRQFLISVDGGRLESSTSSHAVSNIKIILKALKSDDLSDLLNRNNIRDEFLGAYCESQKYAPLTIKKYLTSLMHFYDFLINEEMALRNYTADDIVRMKVRVSNWSKSYNSAAREHEALQYEEELEVLLTPEQIKIYESSEDTREAIKLFGEYSSPSYPTLRQSDYYTMREYLLVQISLQNSHRSGVLSNVTLDDFKNGQLESEMIRVKVKQHKTARSYGPAKMYVRRNLHEYLKIFVERVRSQIIGTVPNLFVTFNGTPMESGQISRQINATWQRAGVYGETRPNRNLTCTMFRKSASTAVLEHHPECSKDVADLLLHSERTQRRHYDVRRRELSTSRGASHVGNLLRYKSIHAKEATPKKSFNDTLEQSPRRKWASDEINEIETLFSSNIEEENVSMDTVRAMESDFQDLKGIPLKKIYDKIRSICNNRIKVPTSPLDNLRKETLLDKLKRISAVSEGDHNNAVGEQLEPTSEERKHDGDTSNSDEEFLPPSISNCTSSEVLFSENLKAMLRRVCKSIISVGPISRSRINEVLQKTEDGRRCLVQFSMTQIQSRLKWERRVKNRK